MTAKKEQTAATEKAQEAEKKVSFARVLEIVTGKKPMKGADVKALHEALIKRGYRCGEDETTGEYGAKTAYAVRCFQVQSGLIVDGRAGKFTVTKLGGEWNEK